MRPSIISRLAICFISRYTPDQDCTDCSFQPPAILKVILKNITGRNILDSTARFQRYSIEIKATCPYMFTIPNTSGFRVARFNPTGGIGTSNPLREAYRVPIVEE